MDVKNTSAEPLLRVRVSGDFLGSHAEAQPGAIGVGRTAHAVLVFPYATEWRPGRHVLPLSIDYAAGNLSRVNLLAYLILPLAATAEPAFRIAAPVMRLDIRSRLVVRLESADGQPHRARVRVLTPRGLAAPDPSPLVDVPARGAVTTDVILLAGTVLPESRQGVLIVAQALDGSTERMAVATSEVDIAPDPSWLGPLRAPLFLATLILVGAGALAEGRRPRS